MMAMSTESRVVGDVLGFAQSSGRGGRSVAEQAAMLHFLFPRVQSFDEAQEGVVNESFSFADEFMQIVAIPKWQLIAKTYGEAVQRVLDLLKKQRGGKFCNRCEEIEKKLYLHRSESTEYGMRKLSGRQKGFDILIVPVQLGRSYKNFSVRLAREAFRDEFGLGVFEVGCILLTHPEILQHCDDLNIDCAGDHYDPDGYGATSRAPTFSFITKLELGSRWIESSYSNRGAATVFFMSL